METLKHNTEDNRQRPETAQSSTLLRLPKPILCIADVFHSGSGGTNCTAGGCCFNTPRGSVHSTASHLYMKVWVVARVLTAITSQPAEHTNTHSHGDQSNVFETFERNWTDAVRIPEAVYRTCRTAVFNLMSKPSASATGTHE